MLQSSEDDAGVSIEQQYELLATSVYGMLRQHNATDRVFSKLHPENLNIEYLAALNRQADLAFGVSFYGTPEERARQYLIANYQLFSFYRQSDTADAPGAANRQRQQFGAQLFLKHSMRSLMGTHCIFGWRVAGDEAIDYAVVVHLDRNDRVVMVTSVYLPGMLSQDAELVDAWEALGKWFDPQHEPGPARGDYKPIVERVIIRSRKDRRQFQYALRAKLTTADGDLVAFFDNSGLICQLRLNARAAPAQLGLGRVYDDFWRPADANAPQRTVAELEAEKTRSVLLRGLQSGSELTGAYVTISDQLMSAPFNTRTADFEKQPLILSSYFDRQMAYYHIDFVQRYFRDLGMQILDEYVQLNPVQVVLSPLADTRYSVNEQSIYISRVAERATAARDARVLYHEFVHVVTDALARLRREDPANVEDPRALQILQAAAMDEGLADYIACSLAVRAGAADASFYPPPVVVGDGAGLAWNVAGAPNEPIKARVRVLGGARETGYAPLPYDELRAATADKLPRGQDATPVIDQLIYAWAELWGRFLWRLRCELNPDVADALAAHSIFFLTRWSSFGSGVLALAMADQLLFDGMHVDKIIELGSPMCDWCDEAEVRKRAPASAAPPERQVARSAPGYASAPAKRPKPRKTGSDGSAPKELGREAAA